MKFREGAHAIYKTEEHLVWVFRYRRKVFVRGVKEYAEELFYHIPGLGPDIEVMKVNVQKDHVHMVVVIPPRYAGVRVVHIKVHSARVLRERFPFLGKVYFSRRGSLLNEKGREGEMPDLLEPKRTLLVVDDNPDIRMGLKGNLTLTTHAGQVLSRGQTIDVHVQHLRAKLGDDPKTPRLIRTIPGVGYCLMLEAG